MGPLIADNIKSDSVNLTWKAPESDGGSPITGYVIEKCDAKRMSWSKVTSTDAETLFCTVPNLIEDKPYLFRVTAVNAEGESKPLQSEEQVAPKKPPGE